MLSALTNYLQHQPAANNDTSAQQAAPASATPLADSESAETTGL